jgi:hypothetical protein
MRANLTSQTKSSTTGAGSIPVARATFVLGKPGDAKEYRLPSDVQVELGRQVVADIRARRAARGIPPEGRR